MPCTMLMPQLMQCEKAINSDVPRYDSAARIVRMACIGLAPSEIEPTKTLPYDMAIMPRSFLRPGLPPAANLATAPRKVDFDACPPVFE